MKLLVRLRETHVESETPFQAVDGIAKSRCWALVTESKRLYAYRLRYSAAVRGS